MRSEELIEECRAGACSRPTQSLSHAVRATAPFTQGSLSAIPKLQKESLHNTHEGSVQAFSLLLFCFHKFIGFYLIPTITVSTAKRITVIRVIADSAAEICTRSSGSSANTGIT